MVAASIGAFRIGYLQLQHGHLLKSTDGQRRNRLSARPHHHGICHLSRYRGCNNDPDFAFPGAKHQNLYRRDILVAVAKILAFLGAALVIGLWVLPWLLGKIGGLKTRELFLLTVLVLAMGTMVGTYEFGLPSVFGAFLIGFILRRLRFTEQAIAEITPFRDVFVAIFFVSLGMLLNLRYVLEQWQSLAVLVPSIIAVKFGIVVFDHLALRLRKKGSHHDRRRHVPYR